MNKYAYYKLLLVLGIFTVSVWILTSCLKTDLSQIKNIPTQKEYKSNIIYHKDLGYYFNRQKSFNSVQTQVPTDIQMLMLDSKYQPLDYFFWRKFNSWFKDLKFQNGIMSGVDNSEAWDCDNFAMLYKSLASISAYKGNGNADSAVGLVTVLQINEFGAVPSGGLHMLNIVFTSKNWYIFEPQTGEFIELHKYPNQKYIQYIIM